MSKSNLEQAVFYRLGHEPPVLRARSPGLADDSLSRLVQIVIDFGAPPAGCACPLALFVQPLGKDEVAIFRVTDQQVSGLAFHVLVLSRTDYQAQACDPFLIAESFSPPWLQTTELPALSPPRTVPAPRKVAEVQAILRRIKSGALREGEDPETVERTEENSMGPAFLGGVQALVDGGRLVFIRPAPDPDLVRGLWALLPVRTRQELWPTTFALGNALAFDVLVLPGSVEADLDGYTTEEQAADYPAGNYEHSLQIAAESGDQDELDRLLARRSPSEMIRLALFMVVVLSVAVLVVRWPIGPGAAPPPQVPGISPEQRERAALAAAATASGDPWIAIGLHQVGTYRRAERIASAAAIAGSANPWSAVALSVAANNRYAGIWKSAP